MTFLLPPGIEGLTIGENITCMIKLRILIFVFAEKLIVVMYIETLLSDLFYSWKKFLKVILTRQRKRDYSLSSDYVDKNLLGGESFVNS